MTFPSVRIADLPSHVGQTVTVRGWVTHFRSSGKIAFPVIRDGSGVAQCVVMKNAVPPETWESLSRLSLEASGAVTGEVRAEPRAPGGHRSRCLRKSAARCSGTGSGIR